MITFKKEEQYFQADLNLQIGSQTLYKYLKKQEEHF